MACLRSTGLCGSLVVLASLALRPIYSLWFSSHQHLIIIYRNVIAKFHILCRMQSFPLYIHASRRQCIRSWKIQNVKLAQPNDMVCVARKYDDSFQFKRQKVKFWMSRSIELDAVNVVRILLSLKWCSAWVWSFQIQTIEIYIFRQWSLNYRIYIHPSVSF